MTSFSQWFVAFQKEKKVKNITWICGTEQILIDEIVSAIRTELNPDPWNYTQISVGEDSERYVWNEADQMVMGTGGNRLIVVRNAEKLKMDEYFISRIARRLKLPNSYMVFLSNSPALDRLPPDPQDKGSRKMGELIPTLAFLQGKGHLIECKPFTEATAKNAVTWVSKKANISPKIAAHLLNRADGDLRLARDVCNKLSVFPGEVTMPVINEMLAQKPRDSFVDALLALDKKTALLALKELPKADWSKTLGLLDSRLELAGMVHDMQIEHKSASEIATAAGNLSFLIRGITPIAKHYDKKRRLRIREVLALVDENSTKGFLDGSLEVVVAFW